MALGNLLAVMAQEAWYQGQTLKVHYQEIQHVLFFVYVVSRLMKLSD